MDAKPSDDLSSDPLTEGNRSSPSTRGSVKPRHDGGSDEEGPILVPIRNDESTTQAFTYAVALADATGRELVFLDPVPVTTQPLDDSERKSCLAEERAARARSVSDGAVSATGIVRTGNTVASAVERAVTSVGARTVVVEESPADGVLSGLRPSTGERIAAGVDVDVVRPNGRGTLDDVRSILVPVAGGPHSGLAVDAARALAAATGAWIDLLYVTAADAAEADRDAGQAVLSEASSRLSSFDRVDTWSLEAEPKADVADVLVQQAGYYDAVVMGAPTKGRLRRFVSGSTTESVAESAEVPVVVVSDSTGRSWDERTVASDAEDD
ncbi:universal stress protein [Halopelagius longus]|nr:universal stress protein [Halopelagius longus]SDR14753.1 Nucleotide-binding universal stress protein, UspA family [Halopelagius longus]